jgi:endoglucanase
MADWNLLGKLCAARGISGREDEIRALILKEIKPCADEIKITPLGNIVAFKAGKQHPKTKLMISAHMDEVGLIVTHVTDEGLLKFETVGGIDRRILPGKSVTVEDGISGVIGVKPIHLLEKDQISKSVPLKDLYIDIGASSREEAESCVKPGDMVTFDSYFDRQGGMVMSKALDDRAGCALLIGMIKAPLKYDTVFVFAVQEEIGLKGARTAAFSVAPQAAIVVESTTAADVPGVEEDRQVCRLGKGPVISFMDRGTIYDREYFRLAFEAAEKAGVPCQAKQAVAGGNDAAAIHVSRAGVRTAAVSLPCRYLHAPFGMIAQEDYCSAEQLLIQYAEMIEERNAT